MSENTHHHVEATQWSTVAICTVEGCGARWLAASRTDAWLKLSRHNTAAHPGLRDEAANRLSQLRHRRGARGGG